MQRTLLLHFLRLDIQTRDLDPGYWIDRLYTANDLTAHFPERQARLNLVIERLGKNSAPIAVPKEAIFAETNLCGAPCYYEDGRFYTVRSDALRHVIEYDLNTHTIRAQIGGAYLLSGQYIVTDLIRPILQSFILPFYGIKTLHGAVLHRSGRTIMLDGPGGAGKTTTAIMMAQAGFDLLSDDGPFFTTVDDRAYVLSSLDFAHLTQHTLQLFPHLRPLIVGWKDSRDKFAVSLCHLQQHGCTEPVTVTHYIRLRRSATAVPRLSRLDKGQLYRHLVNNSMVIWRPAPFQRGHYPFKAYSQDTLNLISSVVRGAEAYELEFADHHLPEIPALLEHL